MKFISKRKAIKSAFFYHIFKTSRVKEWGEKQQDLSLWISVMMKRLAGITDSRVKSDLSCCGQLRTRVCT